MKRRAFGSLFAGAFALPWKSDDDVLTLEWEYPVSSLARRDSFGREVDMSQLERERSVEFSVRSTPLYMELLRNHLSAILYSRELDGPRQLVEYVEGEHDDEQKVMEELVYVVQSVIGYRRDFNTTSLPDYPRYANETLRLGYGDCIDKTALLGSLLNALGVEHRCLFTVGHVGLLVPRRFSEVDDPVFPLDDDSWVYLETVRSNPIGRYTEVGDDVMLLFDPYEETVERFDSGSFVESVSDGLDLYYDERFGGYL